MNIIGTPPGSEEFIELYLRGKGFKQRMLLEFIPYIAGTGFPIKAVEMIKWPAIPHLAHILKPIQENYCTITRMRDMDDDCI
jgi:hypothetical protein